MIPTSPTKRRGRSPRISISLRFTTTQVFMLLLVTAATSIGLWFAVSVQRNVAAVSQASNLAVTVSDLQNSWLSVVGTLNTFSIALPPAEIRQQLENDLDKLNQKLTVLSSQPLGITPKIIADNRLIVQELSQIGVDVQALVDQIYLLIDEGRWNTALQTRQSEMPKIQARLDDALNRLNTNIQKEVSTQTREVQRLQSVYRNNGLIAVLIGVGLSAWIGLMSRKYMFKPINQLTSDIQSITGVKTAAEITPVTPLPQQDEIGDLSRAFAQMADWVRKSYETLEERIAERTSRLERRTLQLQVAAEVARDITSAPRPEELLTHAVNLIRDRFGFYHAGVFLSDERHEYAVLRAATGEAGREMLAHGHKLRIGETGLVGYVSSSGESRIALDVGRDAVHFKNPLLPETRSEVALPIKLGNRVIGVLDVQSQEPAAFDEESISILTIISDQLAIAIQNARLLQEAQENLSELEKVYRRYDYLAWESFLKAAPTVGYQYDGMNVTPIKESDRAKAVYPLSKAHKAEGVSNGGTPPLGDTPPLGGTPPLSIPLRVRGETIGTLDVWPQGEELSIAETYLLTTISGRLSQILDGARLFEEAQTRASREEAINRLTANFARSLDTDTVLQTAVREMAGLPSVVEATIFLESPSGVSPDDGKGDGESS